MSSAIRLLSLAVMIASPLAIAQAPKSCAASEQHQFDFWIGDWNVFDPDGKQVGENRIEGIADGCALLENWTGASGVTGKSLNIYDATDGKWHQTWVDSAGGRLELAGAFADAKMVLEGVTSNPARPGVTVAQRITWSRNADQSVRQLWESSEDGGKTWSVAFDGKYVRKQSSTTSGRAASRS